MEPLNKLDTAEKDSEAFPKQNIYQKNDHCDSGDLDRELGNKDHRPGEGLQGQGDVVHGETHSGCREEENSRISENELENSSCKSKEVKATRVNETNEEKEEEKKYMKEEEKEKKKEEKEKDMKEEEKEKKKEKDMKEEEKEREKEKKDMKEDEEKEEKKEKEKDMKEEEKDREKEKMNMKEEEEKEEKKEKKEKVEKETEERTSLLDENAEEEKIRFDDILKDLGDFGPYQKVIYFFLFLPTIFRQGATWQRCRVAAISAK
jgi:hypothetical protein